MLKRMLAICLIATGCISPCFAGYGYIAASAAYIKVFTPGEDNTYEALVPKLAVGYGDFLVLCSVYFSAEGFAMPFRPATINTTSKTIEGTLKINSSYGVSLLAGINLDGAIKFYGRLSWITSNFEFFGNKTGGQGGLGLEAKFYGNWAARAEIIRTIYYSTIAGTGSKPRVDEGDLTLVYRFWC